MLNSWLPNSKESSPEPELGSLIRRSRSNSLTGWTSSLSSLDFSSKKMARALSETHLRELSLPKQKPMAQSVNRLLSLPVEEIDEEEDSCPCSSNASFEGLWWGGELDEECEGGGGSDGGYAHGKSGYGDSNNGNAGMDSYYQMMIEANPGNPLLLGNYARFLKEVSACFYS